MKFKKHDIDINGVAFMSATEFESFKRRFTMMQWADIVAGKDLAAQLTGHPIFSQAAGLYNQIIVLAQAPEENPLEDVLDLFKQVGD